MILIVILSVNRFNLFEILGFTAGLSKMGITWDVMLCYRVSCSHHCEGRRGFFRNVGCYPITQHYILQTSVSEWEFRPNFNHSGNLEEWVGACKQGDIRGSKWTKETWNCVSLQLVCFSVRLTISGKISVLQQHGCENFTSRIYSFLL
jgi:hypothetical protein